MNNLNTAIILMAGKGTRMLPYTNNTPKEFLKLNGKVILDYILEEMKEVGIKNIIYVISQGRKKRLKKFLCSYKNNFNHKITIQKNITGIADAIILGYKKTNEESVLVVLPDNILNPKNTACLIQMHIEKKASVIAYKKIHLSKISLYGVLNISSRKLLKKAIEKPKNKHSILSFKMNDHKYAGVLGRYVITNQLIRHMKNFTYGKTKEKDILAPLNSFIKKGQVYAFEYKDKWYDVGNKKTYEALLRRENK